MQWKEQGAKAGGPSEDQMPLQVSKGQMSELEKTSISSLGSVPSVLPTELSKRSF